MRIRGCLNRQKEKKKRKEKEKERKGNMGYAIVNLRHLLARIGAIFLGSDYKM
jgi:hypothetical protein